MLKVIAQDFIHSQHIGQVIPLYQELVALTRQEPYCLSYELFTNQKTPATSSLSSCGQTAPRWTPIVLPSTFSAWYRRSTAGNGRPAPTC